MGLPLADVHDMLSQQFYVKHTYDKAYTKLHTKVGGVRFVIHMQEMPKEAQVHRTRGSNNCQKWEGKVVRRSELGSELTSLAGSEFGSELTSLVDIQCVGSDTRPPMLDRTDFASWKQRIRLYCRGKENGVNILKSIDEGPFQIGQLKETLTEGTEDIYSLINHDTNAKDIWDNVKMLLEGSELTKEDRESKLMQLNSKFVNNMLPEWGRFVTAVKLNRGLRDSNYDQLYAYLKQYEGRQNRGQGNNARGAGATGYGGAQNRVGYANPGQARQIKCYNCNGICHLARNCTQLKQPQNSEYFKDKMLLMQAQENGVALDEEQLLFIAGGQDNAIDEDVDEQPVQDLALNVDNVFQADDCDAFDSDVDEAPTAQTLIMVNLSSADPVYDEVGPSYDSNILFEVHDHDHYQDVVCEHHEVHEMHDDVQPNYVVDSHTDYTSHSNMTPYDQYVKDNTMQVIQSDVYGVPNDAYMMILNDMHEPRAQHVYVTTQTKGIQKALTTEIKEMKTIFYELETQVDQNDVNRKCDEIEQKNLLIANDTLIANCLSKEVFYIATNSELNVSRFSEMHDTHIVVQARCLELETELSKLKDKIQKDDHDVMVKSFSNLDVQYLNLQLKYQHLKENLRNNNSLPVQDGPDFDSIFEIKKLKASIQGKDNAIRMLRMQIYQLQETRSDANRTLDFRALDFQITQLTEKVLVLQEQHELFRVENAKVKQHYKELYDSIKITRAKHIDQKTTLLTENENLKVQINTKLKCVTIDSVTPKVLAPGMYAIDVEPILLRLRNNMEVHLDYLKHLKESVATLYEIVEEAKVERPLDKSVVSACLHTKHSQKLLEYANHDMCMIKYLNSVKAPSSAKNVVRKVKQVWKPKHVKQVWKATGTVLTTVAYQWKPTGRIFTLGEQCPLTRSTHPKVVPAKQPENVSTSRTDHPLVFGLGCSKHMTGDRSRLKNSAKKFTGIVRFWNDHFGAIMGYRDYVIGDSVISRVYYVEGLGHNLCSVGQLCDSDLEVALRKHSCYV
nr:integrase, catalytic region, zinc finger, CCHC-type, peptidase aspartic, catalytic [Tanacetum cinerariifolium]